MTRARRTVAHVAAVASLGLLGPLLYVPAARAVTPSIRVLSTFATPSSEVTVKGVRGFTPGENVDLFVDSADVEVVRAAATGGFPATSVHVPTSALPGTHWVTAIGGTSGASPQASFPVSTPWPQAGFDETHDGWTNTENLLDRDHIQNLSQVWSSEPTGGNLDSGPLVSGGSVYVGSSDDHLYAYRASGCGNPPCAPQWTGSTGGQIVAAPAVFGGSVFVGSKDHALYAFDAAGVTNCSGTPVACSPLWKGSTGGVITSSPALAVDPAKKRTLVLVGSRDGKLYAFDAAGCGGSTCSPAWIATTGGPIASSAAAGIDPVKNKPIVLVGSEDGSLYALNIANGAQIWKFATAGPIDSSPAFGPDQIPLLGAVYVGSGDGRLYAVKSSNGTLLWKAPLPGPITTDPAVAWSRVFVATSSSLYSFNAAGCGKSLTVCNTPVWRGAVGSPVHVQPSVAGGLVFLGADDGRTYAFDSAGCQSPTIGGTCPPSWSSPAVGGAVRSPAAVSDGVVFVGGRDQILHAYARPNPPTPPGRPNPSDLQIPATPIRHVVVVYQENHSFDNVFGKYCVDTPARGCDGATSGKVSSTGDTVPLTHMPDIIPDVSHNLTAHVNAWDNGKMDGFDQLAGCRPPHWELRCYAQFHPGDIPNLQALAENFAMSDATFETVFTATFGSHMALGAGNIDGFTGDFPVDGPDFTGGQGWGCDSLKLAPWKGTGSTIQQVPGCVPGPDGVGPYKPTPVPRVGNTIFDELDTAGLPWRIYSAAQRWSNLNVWSTCPTFGECLYGAQSANLAPAVDVVGAGQQGALPSLSLVMPKPGTKEQHSSYSQHNGTSMSLGDTWIADVVSAIENGPDWNSTVIFVTYDDCGCFYDHVPPPDPAPGLPRPGLRVPMVIVSPYAKPGFTSHAFSRLTGMIRFAEQVLGLPPLGGDALDTAPATGDYMEALDFTQAPLEPVRMVSRPLPKWEVEYFRKHPPPPVDPA